MTATKKTLRDDREYARARSEAAIAQKRAARRAAFAAALTASQNQKEPMS